MSIQHIEPMVNVVIENLHLLGYEVISMDESKVTLKCSYKILSMPTDEFTSFFHLHISFIKDMLDKLTKQID